MGSIAEGSTEGVSSQYLVMEWYLFELGDEEFELRLGGAVRTLKMRGCCGHGAQRAAPLREIRRRDEVVRWGKTPGVWVSEANREMETRREGRAGRARPYKCEEMSRLEG